MSRSAFYAYPAEPGFIADSVLAAADIVNRTDTLRITPWQKTNVIGLKIDDLIRDKLLEIDLLVADLTYPNFNVYYEIGYSLGAKKPFVPTVCSAVEHAIRNVNLVGMFDTIGQIRYENSAQLSLMLQQPELSCLTNQHIREQDHTQPLFLLDTLAKIDFRNYIVQTIANSAVRMRAFDPAEVPRLSLPTAISDISSSVGVIIPLLSPDISDSLKHNLRAAFLAGLSHRFGIETLILQYEDIPAPVDYRDLIDTVRSRREVDQAVTEFCQQTLINNQQRTKLALGRRTLLQKIDLGASSAESEAQRLDLYFVDTAEFSRALRSSAALVVGRKGSGKSAIFQQAVSRRSEDKRQLIVELNPASHHLSELRHELVAATTAGVFEHTIAAFWQYILYIEVLLRIREYLLPRAKYNLPLLRQIQNVEEEYQLTNELVAADFTYRLELAVRKVIQEIRRAPRGKDVKHHITNVLFEHTISKVRDAIVALASDFDCVALLFDNLDKGWPPRRVEDHDISTVRLLVEALNKIQRDLKRRAVEFKYLVFLRSDVYERLVAETSDRGKYDVIRVDWSDAEQLEYLIRRRVTSNISEDHADAAWQAVNPLLASGSTAMRAMIGSSLMRPRFLIELSEKAVSFAINRGHAQVRPMDVEDALQQHAMYLVSDFGYEVRDVSGLSEDIFYKFLGRGDILTQVELQDILATFDHDLPDSQVIDLLMWYGFLGIPDGNGSPVFIYDRQYDMRRLDAERGGQGENLLYCVNPAFLRGLTD